MIRDAEAESAAIESSMAASAGSTANIDDLDQHLSVALQVAFPGLNADELKEVEFITDALSEIKTARMINHLLSRLPRTPGGEAIARFLLADREPLAAAAARIQCAQSSLLRSERQLKRFLAIKNHAMPGC